MNDDRHPTDAMSERVALREAVESGLGFRDAVETERVARWALAEIERLQSLASEMADTLRAVLMAVDSEGPYPWQGGALKRQIREDITAYELLGLDVP